MMNNFLVLMICLVMILSLNACTRLNEYAKGFAGVSTKVLEDGRLTAVTKSFEISRKDCIQKTEAILKTINAYIYAKDLNKGMIAVYVSSEDTTPVGFFFTQKDDSLTQIEVTSPSIYAKEKISSKVFSLLGEELNPKIQK